MQDLRCSTIVYAFKQHYKQGTEYFYHLKKFISLITYVVFTPKMWQ